MKGEKPKYCFKSQTFSLQENLVWNILEESVQEETVKSCPKALSKQALRGESRESSSFPKAAGYERQLVIQMFVAINVHTRAEMPMYLFWVRPTILLTSLMLRCYLLSVSWRHLSTIECTWSYFGLGVWHTCQIMLSTTTVENYTLP